MPRYMVRASYTSEGLKGLIKDGGVARRDAVTAGVEAMGGSVETFLYAFGEDDVYVIVDVPDRITMASIALTVGASGAVSLSTTVMLTPEEIDEAIDKTFNYHPPGHSH